MRGIAKAMTELVGNTPMVRINGLSDETGVEIIGKLESHNPLGSVKDRIAKAMIEDAEQRGLLKPGGLIIEPTSGNTGIGISFVAACKGYSVILTMPESMSIERRKLLKTLGAQVVLTPAAEGMKGAVRRAEELQRENPGSFIPQQFENPANPEIHRTTTGPEIWRDSEGNVDAFVAGVGTGGTLTGVGKFLKSQKASIHLVAVEPADSPILSGGTAGPHRIQGIGAGFIPGVLDQALYSEVVQVSDTDAGAMARRLAREEGILVGISAGANVFAAWELAKRPEYKGKMIVTILCDTGERYLSTWLFEQEDQ